MSRVYVMCAFLIRASDRKNLLHDNVRTSQAEDSTKRQLDEANSPISSFSPFHLQHSQVLAATSRKETEIDRLFGGFDDINAAARQVFGDWAMDHHDLGEPDGGNAGTFVAEHGDGLVGAGEHQWPETKWGADEVGMNWFDAAG